MKVEERFLEYIKINTVSDETSSTHPSTSRQLILAKKLVEELKVLGILNAHIDENGNVMASIEASKDCKNAKVLGFIAHMDTVGQEDDSVNPQIIRNYDGNDVTLGTSGKVLSVSMYPELKEYTGRNLITTDGTTILGADDKAGVAEIMTLCELLKNSDEPHGKICIGFTPDEEIGQGGKWFDVEAFGADYAYTLDGDLEGGLEYENFNAASAVFEINGVEVHPGAAKGVMINAASIACKIQSMLPNAEVPELTEEYEGFYHLTELQGNTQKAKMTYIVRHHDAACFKAQKMTLEHIEKVLNEEYGKNTVTLVYKESYKNMAEIINQNYHLIENAKKAMQEAKVIPIIKPIRGGTDGATLSYRGLPCPNLGTGGNAFHGVYEHITVEGMEAVIEIMFNLVKIYSKVY
ncbi:tripeptide aminopeptidase [Lachnotalea glycerini]|uniref:Peptidase T n=1 Tax=Lachnotalea glycerini TaxID=1763509 RepID=A0A255I3F6_9FIRM|nr:peptidase T [Lachnotalea glycerini]PXV93859.1 tripeptide aminopeptidase [Lachnotalea glycerini]RDY30903.1 peptidase T [Lachnotalea glycerini]